MAVQARCPMLTKWQYTILNDSSDGNWKSIQGSTPVDSQHIKQKSIWSRQPNKVLKYAIIVSVTLQFLFINILNHHHFTLTPKVQRLMCKKVVQRCVLWKKIKKTFRNVCRTTAYSHKDSVLLTPDASAATRCVTRLSSVVWNFPPCTVTSTQLSLLSDLLSYSEMHIKARMTKHRSCIVFKQNVPTTSSQQSSSKFEKSRR